MVRYMNYAVEEKKRDTWACAEILFESYKPLEKFTDARRYEATKEEYTVCVRTYMRVEYSTQPHKEIREQSNTPLKGKIYCVLCSISLHYPCEFYASSSRSTSAWPENWAMEPLDMFVKTILATC